MLADAIRSRTRALSAPIRRSRRSAGVWVLVGVPVLLLTFFVWEVASPYLHTDLAVRDAVSVGRASLEPDPLGARIDFVLVDRVGQDTTVDGDLTIRLNEPDGAVWHTTRSVTAASFAPLPAGGLLAGRLGYSLVVPVTDWLRTPRSGGGSTVTINVQPVDGGAFSTVEQERFP